MSSFENNDSGKLGPLQDSVLSKNYVLPIHFRFD